MHFAVNVPNHGALADPFLVIELAREAENSGWDGFFIWDHLLVGGQPVGDTWQHLASVALNTHRLRLGPMVTPLPRRKPWEVARQAVTLDRLSGGRLVLGLGLGSDSMREYSAFGEPSDGRRHADMLEEGLEIISGLWTGEPFRHVGKYYRVDEVKFRPQPLQQPRIPLWLAGTWPRVTPFKRAAAWDGAVAVKGGDRMTPEEVSKLKALMPGGRGDPAFDIVVTDWIGEGTEEDAQRRCSEFAKAGATWYQLSLPADEKPDRLLAQVATGPPRPA